MNDVDTRELVRLRHELRRLRSEGRRDEAEPLLERLRLLAARDPQRAQEVDSELQRWQWSFGLG